MLKCSDLKNEYFESYDLQICFREKQVFEDVVCKFNNMKLNVMKHTEKIVWDKMSLQICTTI